MQIALNSIKNGLTHKKSVRREECYRASSFIGTQNGVDDMMTLQTEKSYGALLENALDAVFLTRPDGTILYVNIWRQSIACGGSSMGDPVLGITRNIGEIDRGI
jgi:hypothetical protein